MKYTPLSLLVVICLTGCGTIYSPTINLPHEPLAKNEGQLTASISALPQQGSYGSIGLTASGEGQVSYAFTDKFSLQGKAWSQLSQLYQFYYNGGTSLAATYILSSKDAAVPLGLIGSTSMLLEGMSIKAFGGSLQLAAWLPEFGIFRPYAAIGAGFLSADFSTDDWGYGGIVNVGTSVKFSDRFFVNVEVFGSLQRYMKFSNVITGFLAPSLSISWKFDNN